MHWLKRCLASLAVACGFAFAQQAQADFINFGLTVNNLSASPIAVSYLLTAPTTLTGLVSYSGTLGATLMDNARDGVSVSPMGGFIMQGLLNGIPVGQDALGTLTASLASQIVFSGTFDCGAGCNTMSVLMNFVLSSHDNVQFSGNFTVVSASVPEPGTLLLLGIGLVGLLIARMRSLNTTRVPTLTV